MYEHKTFVAGVVWGINPFDQPDVESAKIAARGMLEKRAAIVPATFTEGTIEVRSQQLDLSGVEDVTTAIKKLFAELANDGYVSIQSYMNRNSDLAASDLREAVAEATNRPTTFGWAPRFLHSTGQYHKGGPRQGVFLQLVSRSADDLAVPGRDFTFGELIASQAAGDAKVLADLGRPVLTLTLTNPVEDFKTILRAIG